MGAYEEAMDVGEEDGQLAARPQQLCILYGGHEVTAVWSAGCGAGHGSIVSVWKEKWRAGPLEVGGRRCVGVEIRVLPAANGTCEGTDREPSRLTFPSRPLGPSHR